MHLQYSEGCLGQVFQSTVTEYWSYSSSLQLRKKIIKPQHWQSSKLMAQCILLSKS